MITFFQFNRAVLLLACLTVSSSFASFEIDSKFPSEQPIHAVTYKEAQDAADAFKKQWDEAQAIADSLNREYIKAKGSDTQKIKLKVDAAQKNADVLKDQYNQAQELATSLKPQEPNINN